MAARTGSSKDAGGGAGRGFARGLARGLGRLVLGTWRLSLAVLFVLGGIALGGFLNFVHQVQGLETLEAAAAAPEADAIVVLTGGTGRIDAGIELLAAGRGERMLISGVNARTSSAALQNAADGGSAGERARLFACCIDLGRAALDTVGNAAEARDWIRERGFDHVLVVTSDYHMPRSLLEFRRALNGNGDGDEAVPAAAGSLEADADAASDEVPDATSNVTPVRLTAWPVATPTLREPGWYGDPAAIRRMVGEWGKYLSAQSKGWFGAEFLKRWFPSA